MEAVTAIHTLIITEPEDIELLQKNVEATYGAILKVEEKKGYWEVEVMIESVTQLYLLGRYVGCDRKRIFDKDF